MPIERKLQLAEKANEIYREQKREPTYTPFFFFDFFQKKKKVKFLQYHLNDIRTIVQEKDNIIENLTLRYDLGLLPKDKAYGADMITSDKINDKELRMKAEGLAHCTILENFELRELVGDLKGENVYLIGQIHQLEKHNKQKSARQAKPANISFE
ncbi:hypothetical protein RFI_16800 [Reticulomyxa filosa]|uniref:Uncharacterized protein n=1 Tax=Reticulomyxa filosa TaxID=46433 RepID=X6N539_RETFI|nr:hypothetical protein RFI_16800 [Reticulomyxa filosa]|eukprot:ETO20417.1 hypothetical protein RFI_16800 [Reticulomyxa filosa]